MPWEKKRKIKKDSPQILFAGRAVRTRRGLSRGVYLTLTILAALSLMIMDRSGSALLDRTRIGLTETLSPLIEMVASPIRTLEAAVHNVNELGDLRTQNIVLKAQVDSYQKMEHDLLNLRAENEELRRQLNFVPRDSFGFITAPVIMDSSAAFVRSAVVRAGENQGVRKGQAVLTGEGLVGRVQEIGPTLSRILLVEDLSSRIPVMFQNTHVRAMLAGNNTRPLTLLYIPDTYQVTPGDRIVTSGDGGVFPQGLPVGFVTDVRDGVPLVQLYANINKLDFVRIVDYGLTGLLD